MVYIVQRLYEKLNGKMYNEKIIKILMRINQPIGYIGSKLELLDFIENNISKHINIENKIFCDLFAGTNIVGRYFKDKCNIISNDLEYYSYVLARKYLTSKSKVNNEIIDKLNSLTGIEGKVFNHYCENGKSNRLYFNEKNGKKIDAIRTEIENMKKLKQIDDDQYYVLLGSLIEATDKVANTTSVYGAFLKKIKKSASKDLILKYQDDKINLKNISYNEDANYLIKKISGDILYIDPPYNHRQYSSNYHILNYICNYNDSDEPCGVTGIVKDWNRSIYSSSTRTKVYDNFEELISNAKFNIIAVSYNNEGTLKYDDFCSILSKYGTLKSYIKNKKTYKADKSRVNKSKSVEEYLFILEKI